MREWEDWGGGDRLLTAIWLQSISRQIVSRVAKNVAPTVYTAALINIHPKKSFLIIWKCLNEHVYDWYFNFQCENGTWITNVCVFPSPLLPVSVVLLDTTSVLGELGWKTYPINGVRRATFWFLPLVLLSGVPFSKRMASAASMSSMTLIWTGQNL